MKRLGIFAIAAALVLAFSIRAEATGGFGGWGWGEWDDYDMFDHAEVDLLDTPAFEIGGTLTGFAPSSSVKHQYFKYRGSVWGHANGGRDDSTGTHTGNRRPFENARVKGKVSMTYRLPDDMYGEPGHRYRNKSDAFRDFAENGSLSVRFSRMYVEMNNGNMDGLATVWFDKEETTINLDDGTFSGSVDGGSMSGAFYGPNGETLGGTWSHDYPTNAGPRIDEAVFTADKR